MAKNNPGTALLIVLIISSLMATVGFLAIQSSSWSSCLDQAVCQKENQFQLAQGLLDCGIARASRDFDAICKNKNPLNGTLQHQNIAGHLHIEPQGKVITMASTIQLGSESPYCVRAELFKDEHSSVRIRCFQR
ncbi:hypothetical protein BH09DEP1_BH09DEP1_2620 [soil metagenome]